MFTAPIQPGHQLIELDQLLPGIYIVSIRSKNGTLQRKIIK
ncbi:MAG: T9SS type A sorting domain-containing protein [Saprospiraceae bacterium]|nr:T9SS type A sorting domain-containing protein [Candidatus Vicinibacter affinis]